MWLKAKQSLASNSDKQTRVGMARDEEGGAPLPAVYGCLGNQIQDDTGRWGSVCVWAQINTRNETLTSSQSGWNGTPGVYTPAFLPSHKRRVGLSWNCPPKRNKNDKRIRNATLSGWQSWCFTWVVPPGLCGSLELWWPHSHLIKGKEHPLSSSLHCTSAGKSCNLIYLCSPAVITADGAFIKRDLAAL